MLQVEIRVRKFGTLQTGGANWQIILTGVSMGKNHELVLAAGLQIWFMFYRISFFLFYSATSNNRALG